MQQIRGVSVTCHFGHLRRQ